MGLYKITAYKINFLCLCLLFALLRRKPPSLRPWMNTWRVPYEAHTSVVGFASEGSALRSIWRSHACVPKLTSACRP